MTEKWEQTLANRGTRKETAEAQFNFGKERTEKLAKQLNLSYEQTIEVLNNFDNIRKYFDWVNADSFINHEKIS